MNNASREQSLAPVVPALIVVSHTERRWVRTFYLFDLLTNALFTNALAIIYLVAHGYSPFAIGLFSVVYDVTKLLAEVPTGIFADLIGRRKSLMLFCVLSASATVLYLVPILPLCC